MEYISIRKDNNKPMDMLTFHYDGICLTIRYSIEDPFDHKEEFKTVCLSHEDTRRLYEFMLIELKDEL